MDKKKIIKIAILVVCVALVGTVLATCFTVVKAGHTGVVLTFGAVEENVFDEGLHFKIPLFVDSIRKINPVCQFP